MYVGYQIAFSRTVGQERADLSLAGTGSVVTGLSNSTAARMNTMVALPRRSLSTRSAWSL